MQGEKEDHNAEGYVGSVLGGGYGKYYKLWLSIHYLSSARLSDYWDALIQSCFCVESSMMLKGVQIYHRRG